jgi:hypothetical protein
LEKPLVPFSPVKVKATVVDVEDGFVVIVRLDIWVLVMFPLIARSTVSPLPMVAVMVVADGVEEGLGVPVGVCVGVGLAVGMAVGWVVG